jgi:hypothetical protein
MTGNIFQNIAIAAVATIGLGFAATAQAADPGEKAYTFEQLSPASTVVETNARIAEVDSDSKTPQTSGAVAQVRVSDSLRTQIVTRPVAKGGGR